jgi:urease accessory protein
MLEFRERLPGGGDGRRTLTLTFAKRQKNRQRAVLDDGAEVAIVLAPGVRLEHGDELRATDGTSVRIVAAQETLSTARCVHPLLLARACYHLGNRHVALQIGDGWVRYEHDHVLDDMLRGLGLRVSAEVAPFQPERGAYHSPSAHEHGGHEHGDHSNAQTRAQRRPR